MKHYVVVKIVKNFYLLFLLSLFVGCNQHPLSEENRVETSVEKISLQKNEEEVIDKLNLKIIKSAQTKYKVKDVKIATKKIKELAKNYNGYISDLQFQNNLHKIQNHFTVKIPKENFDIFLDSIRSFITFIDFENISTQDVTEQYFDAESRLKTKTEVKERYEEILRKKAKTVDDVLNTEEKLRVIQEELEATKGKLNYLKNRISFSTIDVELYEVVNYKPKPETFQKSFFTKIKEGLINGSEIIFKLMIVLINIWPILLLIIGVFFIYKKRKNNQ
jgi:Ni,Fe-hydrogenase I large subunit